MRIGVAGFAQETNTFSPRPTTLDDFEAYGILTGDEIAGRVAGEDAEMRGALEEIAARGATAVPLMRAWAVAGGRQTAGTFATLRDMLVAELRAALPLDGFVLCLHGAMCAEGLDDASGAVIEAARGLLGDATPIAVTLDLHANVTTRMVRLADVVAGFRTYPHVDNTATGRRGTAMLLDAIEGRIRPVVALSKRPMVVPAEGMSTNDEPMSRLRADADALTTHPILDVSLFPMQPWLDAEEGGFGAVVMADADADAAARVAANLADKAWEVRKQFQVELVQPTGAIERARGSGVRPFLLTESSDSPPAGATGDSAAMVAAFLDHSPDLRAYVTVVDGPAVDACLRAGVGADVSTNVGATLDTRFYPPVAVRGTVVHIGDTPVTMDGPQLAGMRVSMGRYAVLRCGRLSILLSERAVPTWDPAVFRHAGLALDDADVIVVRSPNAYRAAYPPASVAAAITLDLPGASTPRLDRLEFTRVPRPFYPVDAGTR